MRFIFPFLALSSLFAGGCSEQKNVAYDPLEPLADKVSGGKAFEHVSVLVNFGPRPAGSDALEESRRYIEKKLNDYGWTVERQVFTGMTPDGEVEFTNLRARFGDTGFGQPVIGLLASHYDTKPYQSFEFVGANDGGSSSGLLIELARVLAERPETSQALELVFFDGEEAFGPGITSSDGLYGSRHYAGQWLTVKERDRPQWGVLLDMVGDKDLKIRAGVQIPGASLKELAENKSKTGYVVDIHSVEASLNKMSRQLLSAAADLSYESKVGISSNYIVDDHVPLNVSAGIPTIDLIDFDYDYWHTPGDTLDKISAESLEVTGQVTLHYLEKYLLP